MRPVWFAAIVLASAPAHAQAAKPATPAAPDLQAQSIRLTQLSVQIEAEVQSMKRFELPVRTIKKINEADATIKRLRAASPAPAATPR